MIKKLHINESNSLQVGDSVRFMHAGGRLSPETAKVLSIDSDGFCKLRWSDGEISTGVDPHSLLHTGVEADSYEDEFGEDDDWYTDYPDDYYESKKVVNNKKRIKESILVEDPLNLEDYILDIFDNNDVIVVNSYVDDIYDGNNTFTAFVVETDDMSEYALEGLITELDAKIKYTYEIKYNIRRNNNGRNAKTFYFYSLNDVINENLNNGIYADVQVGMKWVDDEFTKECIKISGNKCWIEERWSSMDSDEEHCETSVWNITKGENCDVLIDPKYEGEWYGKIYVNSAINLEQFYPDYWDEI